MGREGKEEENQKRAVDGHANGSVVSGRCPPTANGTQHPACWEPGSVFVDDLEVCTLYLYLDLCMRLIIIGVSRVSYSSLWAPTLVTSDQALRRLHAARHGRLGRGNRVAWLVKHYLVHTGANEETILDKYSVVQLLGGRLTK